MIGPSSEWIIYLQKVENEKEKKNYVTKYNILVIYLFSFFGFVIHDLTKIHSIGLHTLPFCIESNKDS